MKNRRDGLFIWHWGHNPGYRSFVMASPQSGNGLAMAEALGQAVLPGPHPVFRFHLLRDGLANWLCEAVDVCL